MKMNKLLPAMLGAILAQGALAEVPAQPTAAPANVAERLQAMYPGTRFGPIAGTAWPGVFEVSMGNNLAYVDASGQYFLFGHLYDMKAQRDLTAEREAKRRTVDFAQLPLADALHEVRGKGTRTLVLFSDPDCPYCRQLESELKSLDDVTIHRFLLPLASLHPEARAKAIAVWCAPNRLAAWEATMRGEVTPKSADCAHPIDRNVALAEKLQIFGTPTLIAGDGRLMPGVASTAELERWLTPNGNQSAAMTVRARVTP